MNEEEVRYGMQLPWVATASDGSAKIPDGDRPHPRSFGTFSRKIGHYAIEEKVLPLSAAIRSASGLRADILGIKDRGYLRSEEASGVWNQASSDALKKFQTEQNIESSGKINSLSLIALGLGPKRDQTPVVPPKPQQDQGPQR